MTDAPADTTRSDTAATLGSVTGSGSDRGTPDVVVGPHAAVHPYLHVIVVAVIAAVSVLAWLMVYTAGNTFLWDNAVVAGNAWLFPAICMPFSLLVGLLARYAERAEQHQRLRPRQHDRRSLEDRLATASDLDRRATGVTLLGRGPRTRGRDRRASPRRSRRCTPTRSGSRSAHRGQLVFSSLASPTTA